MGKKCLSMSFLAYGLVRGALEISFHNLLLPRQCSSTLGISSHAHDFKGNNAISLSPELTIALRLSAAAMFSSKILAFEEEDLWSSLLWFGSKDNS